jgi:Bardet-Biedl syndrome 7 protein
MKFNFVYLLLSLKVAIADQDGVLQIFSVKKGDIQIVFKTLPGAGISRLELGGALGLYVFPVLLT